MCFECDSFSSGGLVTADPNTLVEEYGARFIPRLAVEQRANWQRARLLLCEKHASSYLAVIESLEAAAKALEKESP